MDAPDRLPRTDALGGAVGGLAERRLVGSLDGTVADDTMALGKGLQVLGVSFQTAPLAVREQLALSETATRSALAAARSELGEAEVIVLSTCNRTELYAVARHGEAVAAWHRGVLGAAGADASCPALVAARYHHQGRAAARHLFRVAAGLESALLGDNEIVGQLRAAARLADEAGTLGPRLRLAVDHALRTSKQARSQTTIDAGGAGVGAAVARLVAGHRAPGCRVVLIGAGTAAAAIARELDKRLGVDLVVVNRSPERAASLAVQHGGSACPLEALQGVLLSADVVVTATARPQPIITPALVAALRAEAPGWAPLVIDAGVPRNVDPACGVDVATLESLAQRTHRVSRVRAAAITDVERCIREGLARWHVVEVGRLIRQGLSRLDTQSPPASVAS